MAARLIIVVGGVNDVTGRATGTNALQHEQNNWMSLLRDARRALLPSVLMRVEQSPRALMRIPEQTQHEISIENHARHRLKLDSAQKVRVAYGRTSIDIPYSNRAQSHSNIVGVLERN